jgi:uncharacterized repeat protein (TIGR03803 family)
MNNLLSCLPADMCIGAVLAFALAASAETAATPPPKLLTITGFNGADGYFPQSGLTLGSDGYLYGTTAGSVALNDTFGNIYRLSVNGDVLEVLYTIQSGDGMGNTLVAGLTEGSDHNFYGATAHGDNTACYDNGATGCGALFRITSGGVPTVLHQFAGTDGWEPYAAPVEGPDGYFYGTTYRGGLYNFGTVYKMTSDGNLITLHSFTGGPGDGAYPMAGLALVPYKGTLYGTTSSGGASNMGTIFSITLDGVTKILHSFTGTTTDGRTPLSPLVLAKNGNFYGTTQYGGGNGCFQVYAGCGTIYEISPKGKFILKYVFPGGAGGEIPVGPLVQSIDGRLYGSTRNGGTYNTITCWIGCGTVFSMSPSGAFKTLASFGAGSGWVPVSGLTLGPDHLLYGTTPTGDTGFGYGTIYTLVPPSKGR